MDGEAPSGRIGTRPRAAGRGDQGTSDEGRDGVLEDRRRARAGHHRDQVERGYLETVPDPTDGRARSVRATARGWRAVDTGVDVIASFDDWLEEQLGAAGVTRLRRDLHLILEAEIP